MRPVRVCRSGTNVEAFISVTGTVLATSRPELCPLAAHLGFAARPGMAGWPNASRTAVLNRRYRLSPMIPVGGWRGFR